MFRLNEKGVVHFFALIILLVGLVTVVYLVGKGTNIFPKASVSRPTISGPTILCPPKPVKACSPGPVNKKTGGGRQECKIFDTICAVPVGWIVQVETNPTTPPAVVKPTLDGYKKAQGSKRGDKNYDSLYDANNDGQVNVLDLIKLRSQF